MLVCVFMYMSACVHRSGVSIFCLCACLCVCVCVPACICVLVFVCLCLCLYVWKCVPFIYVCLCLYVYMCLHVCVSMCVLLHVGLGQHRPLTAPWPGPQVWPLQAAGAHVGRAVHEGVPGCVGGQGGQGGLHSRAQPLQQILGGCHGGLGAQPGHTLSVPAGRLSQVVPWLWHLGIPAFPLGKSGESRHSAQFLGGGSLQPQEASPYSCRSLAPMTLGPRRGPCTGPSTWWGVAVLGHHSSLCPHRYAATQPCCCSERAPRSASTMGDAIWTHCIASSWVRPTTSCRGSWASPSLGAVDIPRSSAHVLHHPGPEAPALLPPDLNGSLR